MVQLTFFSLLQLFEYVLNDAGTVMDKIIVCVVVVEMTHRFNTSFHEVIGSQNNAKHTLHGGAKDAT
jgi:hypothetical protein